ncbi:uncharacterized protein ISCGN_013441 [Ixodes scapularis]
MKHATSVFFAWNISILALPLLLLLLQSFANNVQCASASTARVTSKTAPRPTLMDILRDLLNGALDTSAPTLTRKLLAAELSPSCMLGLLKLVRGVRSLEPWTLRLIDATGKYPTGLFQGTRMDLGAFDECVETVVHDEFGYESVRGTDDGAEADVPRMGSVSNQDSGAVSSTRRSCPMPVAEEPQGSTQGGSTTLQIHRVRRMGNTNSIIIVFEGPKVPFCVYYRGAEYRCYLHKKKVEVCGACGRIGHRADVCPTPDKQQCIECGAQNPTDNHNCNPSCALCGKDHPTGDKRCRKRFQTPFLIKQRQWEKRRQQQQALHNRSDGDRDPLLSSQDGKKAAETQRPSRSKSRNTAKSRKASQTRFSSEHRPQAKQESKTSNNNKMSWASAVSQPKPTTTKNPTLPSSHNTSHMSALVLLWHTQPQEPEPQCTR